MIKLNYSATATFTSPEMNDLAEPPLTFKVWRNRPDGWTDAASGFLGETTSVELALALVGLSLVSINDGDKTHRIGNIEKAKELQASVEAGNPGYGDRFILRLALAIIDQQMEREERILGELKKSSPPSGAGAATEPSNGKTAQPISSKATT